MYTHHTSSTLTIAHKMNNSPFMDLPEEVQIQILDYSFPPQSATTLQTFDCGHTENGATDLVFKHGGVGLLRSCKSLYRQGIVRLYNKRYFRFHEPYCFWRFINNLAHPWLLQSASFIEVQWSVAISKSDFFGANEFSTPNFRPLSTWYAMITRKEFQSEIDAILTKGCRGKLAYEIEGQVVDRSVSSSGKWYVRVLVRIKKHEHGEQWTEVFNKKVNLGYAYV